MDFLNKFLRSIPRGVLSSNKLKQEPKYAHIITINASATSDDNKKNCQWPTFIDKSRLSYSGAHAAVHTGFVIPDQSL